MSLIPITQLFFAINDVVQVDELKKGVWGRPEVSASARAFGKSQPKYYHPAHSKFSRRFISRINERASDAKDIYEFGVCTGSQLVQMGKHIPKFHHLWGFDSFTGFPDEEASVHLPKGWGAGRDSASDALGVHNTSQLLEILRQHIGPALSAKTTFVQGYFNESLTRQLRATHDFRPALLVDLDCDLYRSTMDAMRWMLLSELLVPGSVVRYDDWHSPPFWGPLHGQALAHETITRQWGLTWKPWGRDVFELVQIERRR